MTKAWMSRAAALAAALLVGMAPAIAQVKTVDPSSAQVAASRAPAGSSSAPAADDEPVPVDEGDGAPAAGDEASSAPAPAPAPRVTEPKSAGSEKVPESATYQEEEIFGAAEDVFGKGAKGLAEMIQKLLKDQGHPNAYIAGREAGGAFAVGLRYGQGTLYHKVEGQKDVFWSGPSLGFDIGGNGAKTFVLVYNLYDSEDLFRRYPAAEGNLYAIGGFTASYLRRGDVVLIPIRLGVGWRFGANVGYMKFTKKGTVLPF